MTQELKSLPGLRYYYFCWSNTGLECIVDITDQMPDVWEANQLMAALQGESTESNPLNKMLWASRMRATINSHRTYEGYIQAVDDSITDQEVRKWAQSDLQSMADFVRANHIACVFDYRPNQNHSVIR